jgi:hypothetical protein
MLDGGVEAEHVGDIEFKGIVRPVSTYRVHKRTG